MNKEKQVEEMAKILIDYKNKNHIMASTVILADYAEELYTAGYRKQSEVAEEVFDWLEEKGFLNIEVWAIQDVKDELKKKYTEELK